MSSNTIPSSPKVVEVEALMQCAVSRRLVEPAVRPVPFALLTQSKVEDANGPWRPSKRCTGRQHAQQVGPATAISADACDRLGAIARC